MAYHEEKGHCLTEHLIDHASLRQKFWNMPKPRYEDDIIMATRFMDIKSALMLIHDTLNKNMDSIKEWRSKQDYPYLEITDEYKIPTREGICKNGKNKIFEFHGIRIVLINNDYDGRAFYIKTAYPSRTLDDNDIIYELLDDN